MKRSCSESLHPAADTQTRQGCTHHSGAAAGPVWPDLKASVLFICSTSLHPLKSYTLLLDE